MTVLVSAGVLFFDGSGDVLLVRTTYKQDWEIPGGVVESARGETPLHAARREVAEELGLDVPVSRLLTIDAVPLTDEHSAKLAFVFDGGVLDHDVVRRIRFVDAEIAEIRFCGAAEIHRLLVPRLARRVTSTIAARRGPGPWPVYLSHGR